MNEGKAKGKMKNSTVATFAQQWHQFDKVIHPDASPFQRREMQKAFYAGAYALFSLMYEIDDDLSDAEGAARLDVWADEIEEFVCKFGSES
jgi:hypothetical protein